MPKQVIRDLPEECMERSFVYSRGGSGDVASLIELIAGHEEEHTAEIARLFGD